MQTIPDPNNPEAWYQWLKRKLEVRDKILKHIEQRLQTAPQDKHLLFLYQEHSQMRNQLVEEIKSLERQLQEKYQQLEMLVDHYLENWQTEQHATTPAQPVHTEAEQKLQHELQVWQKMLKKVEERLLRLPNDPRLIQLRSEHQWRIIQLQEALNALSSPFATAIPPEQPHLSVPETVSACAPCSTPLIRELETWKQMHAKTQARLSARPELTHLKPLLAHYQQRIAELETQLKSASHETQKTN